MDSSIKCIIVDDEQAFLNTLTIMIQEHDGFEIVGKARSVEEAVQLIADVQPDIVFLDIEMGDGTGFDVIRRTRSYDYLVIFVTAFDQYAVEAFRFSAVDYLLKPISSENLEDALAKCRKGIADNRLDSRFKILLQNFETREKKQKKIVLKEMETHHVIQVDDIILCVAEGSYTRIYIKNQKDIIVSKHLKEYESLLEPFGFVRVHRSHLINLDKVLRYDKSDGGVLQMEEGLTVAVSVRKKDKLSQMLKEL